MPLTLRPKPLILDSLLAHLLAGGIVSDVSEISVLRQLCEALASTQADLDFDLYTLLQGFYLGTAEGLDLDLRGFDHNLARDAGQAASDPVTYTKLVSWVDDILLPAPQVLQATLADGATVLYRSLGNSVLLPSGRSVSGQAPGTTLTSGVNDHLDVNVSGDGIRTLVLGTQGTAVAIAAAIQAAVRALTALNPVNQGAYNGFRCDYNVITPGAYTLRAGNAGPLSSVVVTVSGSNNASATLKLGVTQGGLEAVGTGSVEVPVVCDTIGQIGNVGAGQISTQATPVPGIETVANALAFSNGREPASDDAYRQDIRSYLKALGRGCEDAVERAVNATVGNDGARHVMSSQVLYGAGTIQCYVCDGRSLTVGAQSDVIEDVQDELDGLGQEVGGWVPSGNRAGVTSASVLPVPITVHVLLGPTPDLVSAQTALVNALYQMLYTWPVGASLSYAQMTTRIDNTVTEVLDVSYALPVNFSTNPPVVIGGSLGQKLMPGAIVVTVARA